MTSIPLLLLLASGASASAAAPAAPLVLRPTAQVPAERSTPRQTGGPGGAPAEDASPGSGAQGAAPPGGQLAPGEVPVTALVVGDQIVGYSTIEQMLLHDMQAGRVQAGSPEGITRRFRELVNEVMVRYVKVQAGKDFGFAPDVIDGIVQRQIDSIVESRGGAVQAAQDFEQSGLGASDLNEMTREQVISAQWERAAIGLGPGGIGRIAVDRYVRPGQLYAEYRSRLESKSEAERAQIGLFPERVQLQQLVLDVERHGGEASALQLGQAIRDSLDSGADFAELVDLHDEIKRRGGLLAPQTLKTLRGYSDFIFQDATLNEFVETGQAGDLIGPVVGQPQGRGKGVFLFRFVERLEPTGATPFVDRELQLKMREATQDAVDDAHLWKAIEERRESTFIWPRDSWTGRRDAERDEASPEEVLQLEALGD